MPTTRAQERNSALFTTVLARCGRRILGHLDVEALARTACVCRAGRAKVEALGDAPWRAAVAAIQANLTGEELPPARRGVYSSAAAQAAGTHAQAAALLGRRHAGNDIAAICCRMEGEHAYKQAHNAELQAAAQRVWDTLTPRRAFERLLLWAQECVARSRVFPVADAAERWCWGVTPEEDVDFADFRESPLYEPAMQLLFRRYAELGWRRGDEFDCPAGFDTRPASAERLSACLTAKHYCDCDYVDRDTFCDVFFDPRTAAEQRNRVPLRTGSVEHLEALASPVPFKASARTALGDRLLDTLRGLRGADAELPADWRSNVVSLLGYDGEEEEEEEEEEGEEEVQS